MNAQSHFDVIIIGSGAGGSAAAFNLVRAGARVLLIEKGMPLPRDGSTLDINQVVHQGRFNSKEPWLDRHGKQVSPEEHFNVGGKTKWYGAALLRYGRHEFAGDPNHQCPAWPIAYDDLIQYYDTAEQMLGVREFNCEPDLQHIVNKLKAAAPSLRVQPLPLGLSANILSDVFEARHFDGFASVANLKAEGESVFLKEITNASNFTLMTGNAVKELIPHADDRTRITGVLLDDGSVILASNVMLAAGALHSPRLLQTFMQSHQLTGLPGFTNVGRNLKLHLLTAMVAVSPSRKNDLLRKTRLFVDSDLPHSSVQPLGFDGELISTLIPKFVPRFIAEKIGARAYGFFLQTEDGAHLDNRVIAQQGSTLPIIDYDANRTYAAQCEHQQLISRFRNALMRTGMVAFSKRIGINGTAHASGTLMTGDNPMTSVVDAQGRVHGLKSLYVVDGSVLPRSSRVNPALTIYAWSLRVSEMLAKQLSEEKSSKRGEMISDVV